MTFKNLTLEYALDLCVRDKKKEHAFERKSNSIFE